MNRLLENVKNQNWMSLWLELLVVVVGIFLAVQVDRWNEDRKLLTLEQERIEALIIEIAENRDAIVSVVARHERVMGSAITLMNITEQELLVMDHDNFYSLLAGVDSNPTFEATRSTYDLLVATGEFDVIRDSTLKRRLVEFYTQTEWVRNRDRQIPQRINAFEPFVVRALDHNALMRKIHPAETGNMPLAKAQNQFREIARTPEFYAEISAKWHTGRDQWSQLKRLHSLVLEVEQLLQDIE
jgi:hypothetical protein